MVNTNEQVIAYYHSIRNHKYDNTVLDDLQNKENTLRNKIVTKTLKLKELEEQIDFAKCEKWYINAELERVEENHRLWQHWRDRYDEMNTSRKYEFSRANWYESKYCEVIQSMLEPEGTKYHVVNLQGNPIDLNTYDSYIEAHKSIKVEDRLTQWIVKFKMKGE